MYCTQLHEHERSLVEKYRGQPFVILGVNTDPDPGLLRATQQGQHLAWRSWWDDRQAITAKWGVRAYPTLFLLDGEGKVRQSFPGKPPAAELEKAIEKLMQEVK
jgi:peroxiredoxin